MNTKLKSILLSSVLITTTFGADAASRRPNELDADAPTRKTHRAENAAVANKALPPRGKGGRFVRVKRSLAALGEESADPEAKTHRAELTPVGLPPLPGEVWAMMCAMLPASKTEIVLALSKVPELCMSSKPTESVMKDRETLQKNWGNIVASLLCSNTPVHEVMKANGFDDPRHLMSMIGIEEDTFEGREVGRYEDTDRKDIAAKLATYAEKFNVNSENIITAADIAAGKPINDGDVVVLSYNDMVTHKTALNGKDIHLCVDVHADTDSQLVFNKNQLPQGLKKLYFQNTQKDVTTIGGGFLDGCTGLTHVDLSGLTNVTSIGNRFLSGCARLTKVDLSPLSNLIHIGDSFLGGCTKLTHVDLSAFKNFTSIGGGFLFGCIGLTHLDLSGLKNVTTIGDGFLYGCDGLTQVNLSGLKNVTRIGEGFLSECKELSSVDLSPLRNLTRIERATLSGCVKLKEVKIPKGVRVLEDKTCHLAAKKIMVD